MSPRYPNASEAPLAHDPVARPLLYSFRRCPYAMRARLALAVSQQAYDLQEITLRDKPPSLLAVSPKATVPVLCLPDGRVLDQSLDIMHWALQQHDPRRWLQADPADQAALIASNDGPFKHHLDRYKYPQRYASDHASAAALHSTHAGTETQSFAELHRQQAAACLAPLQARLCQQRWLGGAEASLADMALLPFVRQFAHTDALWFAQQPWPELVRWLQDWETSPLLASVMHKYTAWPAGLPVQGPHAA